MFAPFAIAAACAIFAYYAAFGWNRKTKAAVFRLPEPSNYQLLWGHQYSILTQHEADMYTEWMEYLNSRVYRVKSTLFQLYTPEVVLVDTEAVHHVFKNAYTYVKAPEYRMLVKKIVGRGIVWTEDDEHRFQRRALGPAFSLEAIKDMFEDIYKCGETVVSNLNKALEKESSSAVIDIPKYMSMYTLDVIGRVAFGYDFQPGTSSEAEAISSSWHNDVSLARSFVVFVISIILAIAPWIANLPILPEGITKKIAIEVGQRMLKSGDLDTHARHSMISLLKNQHLQGGLSDFQLVENMSTFMVVGNETTASSLMFILLELSRNPDVQTRLRLEAKQIGICKDYDSLQKLEYLDAVVKEGLRLHGPALPARRVALEDDVIPLAKPVHLKDGTTTTRLPISAGQIFHIPWPCLNIDQTIWGDNARSFYPERWLEPLGIPFPDQLPHGPWARISSFCDGPRSCIGYRLAVTEMKILIMMMITQFKFEEVPGMKIEAFFSPTLQPFVNGKGPRLPLKVSLLDE